MTRREQAVEAGAGPPPSRREFLGTAGLTVVAGSAQSSETASGASAVRGAAESRGPVLAIGAHYDDCAFGIPGILLQAVERGHRVVALHVIGDYSNWKPVRGRGPEIVEGTIRIGADYGVETRFLEYASGRIPTSDDARKAVADVVAEVAPETAFALWSRDHHPDHEAAAQLSQVALGLGDRLLDDPFAPFRSPRRVYYYDNGPRHTIGFEPDTFVDVTAEWPRAIEWLGRLMALVRGEDYAPGQLDGSQRAKEALARYRGFACGAEYAEAVRAKNAYPANPFPEP